MLIFYSIKVYN